jgi:integrase
MARGGMRFGEVLNLTSTDIQERTLTIKSPKSGRVGETVYVPQKYLVRLSGLMLRAFGIGVIFLNDGFVILAAVEYADD